MDHCKSVGEIAVELWKKFGSLAPANVIAAEQVLEQMIAFFNSLVGNSPLHIGHRALPFGEPQTGTIDTFGDRTFVGPVPNAKPSKVVITKARGGDKVVIHVCAFNTNGDHSELATFEITASTPDGQNFEANVPQDTIPTVILDGKTVGFTSMSYSVLLTAA